MSVNYNVVARLNPLKREEPAKYYATINATGKRDVRFISQAIANRSSLNVMDVISVVEGFLQVIPEIIADGYMVDLDEFGAFSITCTSEGCATLEEVNPTKITKVNLQFRPGKLVKKTLVTIDFKRVLAESNNNNQTTDTEG